MFIRLSPDDMNTKVLAFEFLLCRLLSWKAELMRVPINQVRLSKTQALKLLFLASSIRLKDGDDLLDVFDKFYAMQFGPVESDVYNAITDRSLSFVSFDGESQLYVDDRSAEIRNQQLQSRIVESVEQLRIANPKLVLEQATSLVCITHKWRCWKQAYLTAQQLERGSFYMSKKSIRESNSIFE